MCMSSFLVMRYSTAFLIFFIMTQSHAFVALLNSDATADTCENFNCTLPRQCVAGKCICKSSACPEVSEFDSSMQMHATENTTPGFNACFSSPCKNGCRCVPSCRHENGYYCQSSSNSFIGTNCELVAPLLTCYPDRISISVSADLLNQLYTKSKHACLQIGQSAGEFVDMESCRTCKNDNGNFTIELYLPFRHCGTLRHREGDGKVTFSNLLWADLREIGEYDLPISIMSFQCTYNEEYAVLASLRPASETERPVLRQRVRLSAKLELCKIASTCPASCPPIYSVPAGAAYTVAETIHVKMSIYPSRYIVMGRQILLDEMRLSCDPDWNSTSADVQLARGGCETSRLLMRIDRQRSSKTTICSSFKIPRLFACSQSAFFIHAKLRLAKEESVPVCLTPSIRNVKRSLLHPADDEVTDTVRFGPIYLLLGSEGISNSSITMDNNKLMTLPKQKQLHNDSKILLAVSFTVGFLLVLLIAILVAVKKLTK